MPLVALPPGNLDTETLGLLFKSLGGGAAMRLLLSLRSILLVALLTLATTADAAVTTLKLEDNYSDFCLHPTTGDLAAVLPTESMIHLFHAADLAAGKKEPYAKIRVGTDPSGICFKQYGNLEVFAVVSSNDSNLYLIDAKQGVLLRKIELQENRIAAVTGSLNPRDPNLHIQYAERNAGLVKLDGFKSHTIRMFDGTITAVSATGRMAYLDGHNDSLRAIELHGEYLVSEFPSFDRNEPRVRGSDCLPDPFDRLVAVRSQIYNATLEKRLADLPFVPLCFLNKKPLLVGVVSDWEKVQKEKSSVVLQAASYNTLSPVGKSVVLEPDLVHPALFDRHDRKKKPDPLVEAMFSEELPRGVADAEARRMPTHKLRILADDARDRVIVAYRSRLDFVPLADFAAPAEPLLLASLGGDPGAQAGRAWNGSIQLADPAAELVIGELPAGMKAEGNKLRWTPTANQIGPHQINVTLKHKDIQQPLSFEVSVNYPAMLLPFSPTQVFVTPDGSKLLLCNSAPPPRPVNLNGGYSHEREGAKQPFLGLIDVKTNKLLTLKKLPARVRISAVTDDCLVLVDEETSSRVEILDLKTLEKVKAITTQTRFERVEMYGKLLLLQTLEGVELYQPGTFQLVKKLKLQRNFREELPLEYTATGASLFGIELDFEMKPRLLAKNLLFQSFDPIQHENDLERMLGHNGRRDMERDEKPERRPHDERDHEVGGATVTSDDGTIIDAMLLVKDYNRELNEQRRTTELVVRARGRASGSQLLLRTVEPFRYAPSDEDVLAAMSASEAFVVHRQALYRWAIPKLPALEAVAAPKQAVAFVPRQSALVLGNEGKTTLKHEVRHGTAPYRFKLARPRAGIAIDEKTGEVTLDAKQLLADATSHLERELDDSNRDFDRPHGAHQWQHLSEHMGPLLSETLGLKFKGAPFAIPIELTVTDANNREDALNYFVLADVPLEPIQAKLKQQEEERRKANDAAERERLKNDPRTKQLSEDLLKRIDTLEQRLEKTNQQLEQVLKLLEEKNSKP